ncbi:histidine--tRNA ligase [Candidatus Woesearchaeota archaeon]|nr:histidine--tRNA ligase [Candidatus Woesearchaeota archaeon]
MAKEKEENGLMLARGVKDVPPEKKILKQQIVDKLKRIFEQFGFSPLETPIIERYNVLASKYAGGTEILKETFKFADQGGRELGLRYDLTVPFCRFVGMNKTLKMPFKRYQIGRVFRDGPIKSGRMREFWQCDVDVVGTKSMIADAECIAIAQAVFEELELDVTIKFSTRKILNSLMKYAGVKKPMDAILTIDKLNKIGIDGVEDELKEKGISDESIAKLKGIILMKGTNEEKLRFLKGLTKDEEGIEGIKDVEEILSYLPNKKNIEFDLTLARGLAYYTGPVFEVYLKDIKEFGSSLAGGGRYDKMIGDFLKTKDEEAYPATGISFGLEPISVVLEKEKMKKASVKKTVTQIYIIPIGTQKESFGIALKIRKQGFNVDMDLCNRGISKNLNYANSYNIPYVIFIGEEELKNKKVKLKDMKSGKEQLVKIEDIKKMIKK